MMIIYIGSDTDFMTEFSKAHTAKLAIEELAGAGAGAHFWATFGHTVEIDNVNKTALIDGSKMLRFDYLWIGDLDKFLEVDLDYRNFPPERISKGLNSYTWDDGFQSLDLFLYDWQDFPVLPEGLR